MMQVAKECDEFHKAKTKTPEVALSGVFLFVAVNHSVQAVATYLSLSSHLHMQQLTTPAATERRNVMSISAIRHSPPFCWRFGNSYIISYFMPVFYMISVATSQRITDSLAYDINHVSHYRNKPDNKADYFDC